MFSSTEKLKEKTRDMLPPELAALVTQAIEAEASNESSRMIASAPPDLEPCSAATRFAADKFYAERRTGHYSGRLRCSGMTWIASYSLQDPAQPFTFPVSDGRVIHPRGMATDGGSIPQLLRP
jgi:hypothetical protein